MKTASALLLGLLMGLSGCSLHHQQQERAYAHYQDDAAAIREAQAAWLILSSPRRSREWPEARKKLQRMHPEAGLPPERGQTGGRHE